MGLGNSRLYKIAAGMIIAAGILLLMVVAKGLLIPLALGSILAMLLLPVKKKLMSWGFPKFLAVATSVFIIILFLGGVLAAISAQVVNFTDDLPELQEKANQRMHDGKQLLTKHLNMSEAEVDSAVETASSKALNELGSQTKSLLSATTNKLTNFGLTMVYTFLLLFYHERIRKTMLKLSPGNDNREMQDIIADISKVAPSYLLGKFMLIIFLAFAYSIGLTLIGVPYGVLFGVMAAVISIIPYIGNLLGGLFPMVIMFLHSDELWPIAAIILVFGVAQFLESYFLEPIIVGRNVDLNPMTIIIGVVVVGSLWGVAGMIIAIPVLGIMKIVFEHLEPMKPIAYLMRDDEEESWLERKVSEAFKKLKKKVKG